MASFYKNVIANLTISSPTLRKRALLFNRGYNIKIFCIYNRKANFHFGHDEVTGIRLTSSLDSRQYRTTNCERRETHEVSVTSALAFCPGVLYINPSVDG